VRESSDLKVICLYLLEGKKKKRLWYWTDNGPLMKVKVRIEVIEELRMSL
jgi:hypothetical protein